MDLETENRIASILLREAAELRRQAEKEGVRAYLEKPNVRHRPNSRFLTATVLGVQQANKAVETDEMWRLRRTEIEFDQSLKRKSRDESGSNVQSEQNNRRGFVKRCTSVDENDARSSPSSSQSRDKRWQPDYDDHDDGKGLGDVEVETFLQSRVKRGRGSVGPKMDEPFPCLPITELPTTSDTGDRKLAVEPDRWPLLRHNTDSSSSSEEEDAHGRIYRKGKDHKQKLSKRHKSKEKKRDHKSKEKKKDRKEKKKRRDEKKRKHGRD
ncbi:uncharacterized protein LOC108842395 [Raphanus sativus]|uniref:Uncharacterized protein LOC108842395 n=1 Tax=Raphanus sativus TaxID=3726 RepID=A0A6J0MGZ0_RAPSA|nr:uncharacterized protein LOC108842395 [Raphanus sativus]XP_018470796.1 uncharacterized protein LOC108842395 [Raphanus sativus]